MRLAGKSIVVTGASGIAAAGARLAAAEGGAVFVISRDEDECRELVSSIRSEGGDADWAVADLTSEEEAVRAFGAAAQRLGRLDGLFAVAGGSGRDSGDGPAHEIPLRGWVETQEMNSVPMFLATREAISVMRGQRGASIVVVSSVLAFSPSPRLFATHAYAASKGGAIAYVKSLAAFYAADGIRVNGIASGLVRTPMSRRAATDPETAAYAIRKQPLAAGLLDPGDIAPTAVFLLSDDAAQITGQTIVVDGGWSVSEA